MSRHPMQCVLAFITIFASTAPAAEFAGGTGRPDDPYRIATAEQLISIGSDPNLWDRHFVLVNDIDLDPNLSPDYLFNKPLIESFGGVFDGNSFSIRHLTIRDTTTEDYGTLGLFGGIGTNGEVKYLILEDVEMIGDSPYGGGGALCWRNDGRIFRCFASGIVSVSTHNSAGGLVGFNDDPGSIAECGSLCTVSGLGSGGLVGENSGEVRDCYAVGKVHGTEVAGGLVGVQYGQYSPISYCYAACQVESTGSSGGLVGVRSIYSASVTSSYFSGGRNNGIGTALTSAQMKQAGNFVGWSFWGIGNTGPRVPWFMPKESYPELTWLALRTIPDARGLSIEEAASTVEEAGIRVDEIAYDYGRGVESGRVILARPCAHARPGTAVDILVSLGPYDWSTNPGTGEPNDPYLILTVGQLDCLAQQAELWDRHFQLLSDLDMAWRVYQEPVLGRSDGEGPPFNGTFDGNGHIIKSLTFQGRRPAEIGLTMLGLFGGIGRAGVIKDLGLTDVSVDGPRDTQVVAGMFCAVNEGYIGRCYSHGVQRGAGYLAGLVGRNAGIIEDCYAMGEVIEDSRERWDLSPNGGLVAENTGGTIRTCYAVCSTRAGLVGRNLDGLVEHSLWDIEASGTRTSDGGVGLTTQEMMDVQVLQSHGWGGNPNWVVDDGKDYPRSIWEGTPGSLIPAPRQ